jgi:lipoprotein-anchoring transpeptidase ErfK/SrfK
MAGRLCATGVLVAALAFAGCDGGGDETSTSSKQPASTATQAATAPADDQQADKPQLYFTAGEQFKKVPVALPKSNTLEAAATALVEGPGSAAGIETQIPAGVEVQDVEVRDSTATVKVTSDFFSGIPANPAARDDAERQEAAARVGQLTYTLTQFPQVKSVKVDAAGEPVEEQVQRADYAMPKQGPHFHIRDQGEKSSSTHQIQERLADLQYLPRSAVDGKDGYRTQQAVMAFQAWEGLDRDGVAGPITQAALRSAKQPRPGGGGPSRRIEVYRDKGVALLIAHGRVKRAIHVSSGAGVNATPAGTFEVFRKENPSWSVPFQVWLPYASYFTGGIAFHEYPEVPPYPASHGCVRVGSPEAPGVYRFAKLGTAVIVV